MNKEMNKEIENMFTNFGKGVQPDVKGWIEALEEFLTSDEFISSDEYIEHRHIIEEADEKISTILATGLEQVSTFLKNNNFYDTINKEYLEKIVSLTEKGVTVHFDIGSQGLNINVYKIRDPKVEKTIRELRNF